MTPGMNRGRIYSQGKKLRGAVTPNALSSSSSSTSIFKSEQDWFNLDQWDTYHAKELKKTYQYVLFKIKLYEAFDCPEEGYSKIWKELLKFPAHKMIYFPKTKFMNIWESLTMSQKAEIFSMLGQSQELPCVKMISKDYIRSTGISSKSTNADSSSRAQKSDETLFT